MKVFIVEDHPIFRLGLKELLEQEADMTVCGEAEEIGEALAAIERAKPDLVIVDIALKGRNGLDLVKTLSDSGEGPPILVLSMHEESVYAERALRAGALGYIMKHETSESIVTAARSVLKGRVFVSERVSSLLLSKVARGGAALKQGQAPEQELTDREMEVFELLGKGMTTKEISETLCLSPKTIGTYRERIKEKLGHKNAMEMQRHAVQWVEESKFGRK